MTQESSRGSDRPRSPAGVRVVVVALVAALAGCGGATVDREQLFASLRTAIQEEIEPGDDATLERHNQLVVEARDQSLFDGMRRFEVEEKLGRGQECGSRALCSDHGFAPTAWTYEVGRRDGVGWGPTIIVGFDRQGIVDNVYTLTRR